jgi:flagellin-specific chaperone FliS
MNKYIKYTLAFIIFLIVGEIIHNYIKKYLDKKNQKKETFTNYNELPYISDLTKSQPRHINSNGYTPDEGLQPIIVTTKQKTLNNGNLPTIGYVGSKSASIIPINIIRQRILPCEYRELPTNNDVYNNILNNNIDLAVIRDLVVIQGLTNVNTNTTTSTITTTTTNVNQLKVIAPMYYETIYLLTTKELKDLSHFQMVNLLEKPVKLYTSKNDKQLLDTIISVTGIENTKLQIYSYDTMEKAALQYILNPEGLFFGCCHFKNPILQNLLDNVSCLSLDYIPTRGSMYAIGGYSFKKPISDESLDLKIKTLYETLLSAFNVNSNLVGHNLSKNNLINRSGSKLYKTINLRTSLYISNLDSFTNEQLVSLSKNMVEFYQTMSSELNKWNTKQTLNNIDNLSFRFEELSYVDPKLEIEEHMNNELRALGYVGEL